MSTRGLSEYRDKASAALRDAEFMRLILSPPPAGDKPSDILHRAMALLMAIERSQNVS